MASRQNKMLIAALAGASLKTLTSPTIVLPRFKNNIFPSTRFPEPHCTSNRFQNRKHISTDFCIMFIIWIVFTKIAEALSIERNVSVNHFAVRFQRTSTSSTFSASCCRTFKVKQILGRQFSLMSLITPAYLLTALHNLISKPNNVFLWFYIDYY